MGFSDESLAIFRGLTTKGKAKVHINQDFTAVFDIQRGTDQAVFQATMETLRSFESASGALLNLNKTTVIPLNDSTVPTWLAQSGCRVANVLDRFRYLGLLARVDIIEQEMISDLQTRYEKKLNHWSSRLLSWPEKAILAQTVLRMPQSANVERFQTLK
ncbi:hypothetical protein R1sor_007975 [Riccia sorocarpa]|uniref:Reverse transcriptase domain-containing protein n=1 Tax=Riccia sorocarpa TaxID=122646 RepID=A0ABD3HYC1_9MARC